MNTKVRRISLTTILAAIALLVLVSAKEFTAYAREIGLENEFSSSSSALAGSQRQAGEIELYGVIEAMTAQSWTINGQAVAIQPTTEIKGFLAVGDTVKVHVFRSQDGSLVAREIEFSLARPSQNGNTNANEAIDDNSNTQFGAGQNSNSSGLNDNGDDNGNANDNTNLNGSDDNGNANDDNGNDDSSNTNDDNGNDDNSNDDNGNDDNSNDDNGGKGG